MHSYALRLYLPFAQVQKKIIIICNCAVELAMDYKLNHTFKLYAQVNTPICQLSGSRTIISEFSVM